MPKLGLGNKSSSASSMITPGIITDGLVMRHNYNANTVQPLSDGAAYFVAVDGSGNYIQLSSPFNVADRTVTCWIYAIDNNDTRIIFDNRDGASDGFTFFLDSNDKIRAKIDGTTSSSGVDAIEHHRWYHVACVHDDGATTKIYLDGVELTTLDSSSVAVDNLSTNARIGSVAADNDHLYNWNGYMSNMGFWSRTLTQAEIKSIMFKQYADLTTTEKTSLVSFWNLDEAYDSIVFDNYHGGGETLGSELVTGWTNNDFTSLTSSGSDITSAVGDGSKNHDLYSNTLNITAGDTFKITFTLGGNPGSSLDFRLSPHTHLGSADYDTSALSAGTYTYYITSGITDSTSFFGFRSANEVCDFSVTNFSVKKINGNPGELK